MMRLVLLATLLLSLLSITESQASKLVYVQEAFRHGHRYPIYGYQADGSSFINDIRSPGELTKQGKSMHYILGQGLYATYWNNLFGGTPYFSTYNQSKFYVKSTNVNRTIESAQSQLLGIFQNLDTLTLSEDEIQYSLPQWPGLNRQKGNVYINSPKFNPVPVHVEKGYLSPWDKGDFLRTYSPEFCPNQNLWVAENLQRPQVREMMNDPDFQSAIAKLNTALGINISFTDVFKFYDNHVCMLYDGRKVNRIWTDPGNTKDALTAIYMIDLFIKYFYTEQQLATTATGYFNETYNHFKRIQADHSGVQWAFYSAHDTTIGNFIARLNLTNARCVYDNYKKGINKNSQSKTCIVEYPAYTSNLIFEVYKNADKTTFKIRYNGEYRAIPFCNWEMECPVEVYYKWFEGWQNPNYVKSCGIEDPNEASTSFSAAVLEGGVIICFVIAFLYKHLERQHEKDDEKLMNDIEKEAEKHEHPQDTNTKRNELNESLVTDQ